MTLSKQDRDNYVQNTVLKHFRFLKDANVGAMLVDIECNILEMNELCKQRFDFKVFNGESNIAVYDENNDIILDKTDAYGVSYAKYVEMQNKIRLKLHQIVIKDKTPVQFVCFMPHKKEFISLLVHYQPIFHDSGEVVAMQVLASEFSFWGIREYLNFLEMKPVTQTVILLESHHLPVKLTPRQHEIVFLLALRMGQRQAAQILNISYGNLSKIVREIICPKFNIYDADTHVLTETIIKMGYHKYIPQSLCRPVIIVLDNTIWTKYFSEKIWSFPDWVKLLQVKNKSSS